MEIRLKNESIDDSASKFSDFRFFAIQIFLSYLYNAGRWCLSFLNMCNYYSSKTNIEGERIQKLETRENNELLKMRTYC